jgi:hypothetical protein
MSATTTGPYAWAERRKLEIRPTTGTAQLVEIREPVQEIVVPTFVQALVERQAKPLLIPALSDAELLGYGVPAECGSETHMRQRKTQFWRSPNTYPPRPRRRSWCWQR